MYVNERKLEQINKNTAGPSINQSIAS